MMKKSLDSCRIFYHQNDLLSEIKKHKELDFVSLSDVPSYFSGSVEKKFLQDLKSSLASDALIINRNYLRIPNADRSGFSNIVDQYKKALSFEGVQMYRIEVLNAKK